MLKVCHFDPITGGGWVYLPPPPNFCYKTRITIDFSRNFLAFNFCGQAKHNMRSLMYASRCFVEGR